MRTKSDIITMYLKPRTNTPNPFAKMPGLFKKFPPEKVTIIKNKTVVVTGSSRGIGRAIALGFAELGCNIVLNCSRSMKEMEKTLEEVRLHSPDSLGITADVSDYTQASHLICVAEKTFGGIDVLINNAGRDHVGLFSEMQPEDIGDILGVNLFSAINCAHAATPGMLRSHSGCIINISSLWGVYGASCEAVYSAAKGGINAFTMALAKELGPSGIRVNAIACGLIDTQMNAFLGDEEVAILTSRIPQSRFGTPQEAAKLAIFLADEACAYLTGQVIGLDGGFI